MPEPENFDEMLLTPVLEGKIIPKNLFWINRIKFDTSFKYIVPISFVLFTYLSLVFLHGGPELYIEGAQYLVDALLIAVWMFDIYIGKNIPILFKDLIRDNKNMFYSEDVYEKYLKFVIDSYDNKKEKFLSPIMGILLFFGMLYVFGLSSNFRLTGFGQIQRPLEESLVPLNILVCTLAAAMWALITTITISGLILILVTLKCLSQLGTSETPLKVTYKDLKIGAFNSIGKFILSVTIPAIILSTFVSAIGLFHIFAFQGFLTGYFYITLGMLITTLMSFILYRNTTNIHEAITLYKVELKSKLLDFIEVINSQPPGQMDLNLQYKLVYNIHDYYDRIDTVSDWPFNPTSIKKLVVIFSSAILPLLLSFIGLG